MYPPLAAILKLPDELPQPRTWGQAPEARRVARCRALACPMSRLACRSGSGACAVVLREAIDLRCGACQQGLGLFRRNEPSVQASELVKVAEHLDPDRLIQATRLDWLEAGRRDQALGG
jgi:hypothetical protein